MLINRNILHIIFDKVALNKWKNNIKNICMQYDRKFYVDSRTSSSSLVSYFLRDCITCESSSWLIYNYRGYKYNIQSAKICGYCLNIHLPKNY